MGQYHLLQVICINMGKKKSLNSVALSSFGMNSSKHEPVEVICRILIVCEGEKTEPNYFRSFKRVNRGGFVYEIECEGGKINTLQVVNKAIELRDAAIRNNRAYDSVWSVFDKDSFPDKNFNAAIQKAESNGINCAWSNEAFELWYVFHFANRVTSMSRKDYQKAISTFISKHIRGYSYRKNDPNMMEYLQLGDESRAIKLAERQANSFDNTRYAEHEPSTCVYKLVRLLRGEDKKFNERIKSDLNRSEKYRSK